MLERLLENHVLANLTFALVIVMGIASYSMMPRAKDPEINFNWIQILTFLPGATAEDIEKKVTDPLEEEVRKVADIKFVTSSSRENVSSMLIRFEDLDERTFDKRLNDLRRKLRNKADTDLPPESETPIVIEVTTANALPTATLVITSPGDDDNLRKHARNVEKDLERIVGVDNVIAIGRADPELHVYFYPERLTQLGIHAGNIADTVAAWFKDVAAGSLIIEDQMWMLRVEGASEDLSYLASLPVMAARGEVRLGDIADIKRGNEDPTELVQYQGQPAVMLWVLKKANANVLDLLERVNDYIEQRNATATRTGVRLAVVDDQTEQTRNAISVMQTNALLGLGFVLLITWFFLGSRIAILTSIGIPFTLAGTFWLLSSIGQTVNNSVLLGVVISLGMLVDDAVVVVESAFSRLRQGMAATQAMVDSLREMFAPVTSSVLTTMAAFLPLMLMPGIVGKFMMVVPLVVTVALAVSLIEAYWMLPAHIIAARVNFDRPSRFHIRRVRFTHWVQLKYGQALISVMRKPLISLSAALLLFILALTSVVSGAVRINFFDFDPLRLFYVDVSMPPGTTLVRTQKTVALLEKRVRAGLQPNEARGVVSYAGQMLTEMEPLYGDNLGQIVVSLNPQQGDMRSVQQVVDEAKSLASEVPGPVNVRFWALKDGPPTTKPIVIKVRGDDFDVVRAAADALKAILADTPGVSDIADDDTGGANALELRLNQDAVQRAGLNPALVARLARLYADGEIVTSLRVEGEEVDVRVRAKPQPLSDIGALLRYTISLPDGGEIAFGELVEAIPGQAKGNIRHYNFRRAITVDAELDKDVQDTGEAVDQVLEQWAMIRQRFPSIDLDLSGELDDIQESLDSLFVLFLLGIGLIYMILGAQFKSYFQPLLIIATVPMAFTGVAFGLLITGNPLSMFTMYGVVALAGIAVNSAIVMISAANTRLKQGMTVTHAILFAARRRVIPILITSLTTIGGLFSLATGLGGHSLLWGPVATAIVWGLSVSTILTLFVIPLLYRVFMQFSHERSA